MLPNLFGLFVLIVLVTRWARAASEERRRFGLTVMTFGNIVAILPWLAVVVIENLVPHRPVPGGLGTDPYVLAFVLIPLSFLYAVVVTSRGEGMANANDPFPSPQETHDSGTA